MEREGREMIAGERDANAKFGRQGRCVNQSSECAISVSSRRKGVRTRVYVRM